MRLQKLITAIVLASLIYQPFCAFSAEELALPSPDVSVPVIEHEQLASHQAIGLPLELSVKVVDDTGVKNVTLFYRLIGAEQFKRLEMVSIGGQGIYTATIPSEDMLTPGVEYYIQAADTAENTVLRGFDFSPLTILVGSPGLEDAFTEEPLETPVPIVTKPVEEKKKSGVMKWVLIGVGVAAVAGLGLALGGGGGGGGDGGGSTETGSVSVDSDVPQ